MPKLKPNCPRRLIVEGKNDLHSIIHLMQRHGWIWDDSHASAPFIEDAGSDKEAIRLLPIAIKSCSRTGIVVDADINCQNRWEQIRTKVTDYFPDFPARPDPEGTVLKSGESRLGIWLMPNNVDGGKLEDFLATLVPQSDQCWGWAADATKGAVCRGAQFSHGDFIKAHIHTWLAWGREPGMPFGTAITSATFSHDSDLARRFVMWMNALFAQ